MKDKWKIMFIFNGEALHEESDIHLVPRVGDRVGIPPTNTYMVVKDICWCYEKKQVRVTV